MDRLSESNEDLRDFELMICEVPRADKQSEKGQVEYSHNLLVNVAVELQDIQLVHTHDTR